MTKSSKTRKRSTNRGPRKGGSFERAVSVQLSLWVTRGKRKDCFWRSAMSGGRATVFKKRGEDLKHQAGDIVAVHPDGHALTKRFFVEAKHYKNLDIAAFFVKQTGKLWKFWMKAVKQAKAHNLRPLMIAKQNNFPTLLITKQDDYWDLFDAPVCVAMNGPNIPDVYLFDEVLETRFLGTHSVPKRLPKQP